MTEYKCIKKDLPVVPTVQKNYLEWPEIGLKHQPNPAQKVHITPSQTSKPLKLGWRAHRGDRASSPCTKREVERGQGPGGTLASLRKPAPRTTGVHEAATACNATKTHAKAHASTARTFAGVFVRARGMGAAQTGCEDGGTGGVPAQGHWARRGWRWRCGLCVELCPLSSSLIMRCTAPQVFGCNRWH